MWQDPNDPACPPGAGRGRRGAFSLLEILVAMAVLALLAGFLFVAVNDSTRILRMANEQMESFQEARSAFDGLTRALRSATLNTYWDYDDANDPKRYIRQSELHFVMRPGGAAGVAKDGVFFQSARSYNEDMDGGRALTGLLNTCGFYVDYGSDAPPPGVPERHRFRLKQLLLPGANMEAFAFSGPEDFDWFTKYLDRSVSLAENIVLLRIWPKLQEPLDDNDPGSDSLSQYYSYNSRVGADASLQPVTANQMPPLLDITMVAVDESSARRLAESDSSFIHEALEGLFQVSSREQYEADLGKLEERFNTAQPPVGYRIFRATVPVAESKWSMD